MRWLVPLLAVAVVQLTGPDGKPFYFPAESIGPFRHMVGCAGTTIFTIEGSLCVKETPEEIAKILSDLPE